MSEEELLDNCINATHYNIACYIHRIFGNKYKYNNKEWYLLIDDNYEVINENKLKDEIKYIICNNICNRSIYWSSQNSYDSDIKSVKLLKVAEKLKDEKFLKYIIKELTQFYE
jgi:hypothetical protein